MQNRRFYQAGEAGERRAQRRDGYFVGLRAGNRVHNADGLTRNVGHF